MRIRTFYTKKVEETQKKADAQIHALKRASPAPIGVNFDDSSDKKSTEPMAADHDTVPINPTGTFVISDEDREANLRAELAIEYNAQMDVLREQITQQAAEIDHCVPTAAEFTCRIRLMPSETHSPALPLHPPPPLPLLPLERLASILLLLIIKQTAK